MTNTLFKTNPIDLSKFKIWKNTHTQRNMHDPYKNLPVVIVYPDGNIIFSPKSMQLLGSPDRMFLEYSDDGMIAFTPAGNEETRSNKVQKMYTSSGGWPRVTAHCFSKQFNLCFPGFKTVWYGMPVGNRLVIQSQNEPYLKIPYETAHRTPRKKKDYHQ